MNAKQNLIYIFLTSNKFLEFIGILFILDDTSYPSLKYTLM